MNLEDFEDIFVALKMMVPLLEGDHEEEDQKIKASKVAEKKKKKRKINHEDQKSKVDYINLKKDKKICYAHNDISKDEEKHKGLLVRMATLQGINAIMQCDLPVQVINEVLAPSVQELAFDRSEQVRKLFFTSIAGWLGYGNGTSQVDLLKVRLTTPYLLPLLLLGISDESMEISLESLSFVENVGNLYSESFAQDSNCNMMERCCEKKSNDNQSIYFADQHEGSPVLGLDNNTGIKYTNILPAPFRCRPGKGCRRMVQDLLETLLGQLVKKVQDWMSRTQRGAARLLQTLVVMAEGAAAHHLKLLIPILFSAVGENDIVIAKYIVESSHVIGWHVSPPHWFPIMRDHILLCETSSYQVANGLTILSGLLYGTQSHFLNDDMAIQVVDHLTHINLSFGLEVAVQRQILAVLTNLLAVRGSSCEGCSLKILIILLQVQSVVVDQKMRQKAVDIEETFAQAIGFTCGKQLYRKNLEKLVMIVTEGHETWSAESNGYLLFQSFMQKVGDLAGFHIQTFLPLFENCLKPNRDPSLRIRLLQLLDDLFESPNLAPWWFPVASIVLSQIIIPCGVWQAGKVGAAVRHAAMVAFGTFLRNDLCNEASLGNIMHSEQTLPVIISCIEEDHYVDTRLVTCHVLENILRVAGNLLHDSEREKVKKMLQKRLDDSSDKVRLSVLPAISAFFRTMPESYSDQDVKGFVSRILLHMDDSNAFIREAVYKALEVCTSRRPVLVKEVVASICEQHQMKHYCESLLQKAASEMTNIPRQGTMEAEAMPGNARSLSDR